MGGWAVISLTAALLASWCWAEFFGYEGPPAYWNYLKEAYWWNRFWYAFGVCLRILAGAWVIALTAWGLRHVERIEAWAKGPSLRAFLRWLFS